MTTWTPTDTWTSSQAWLHPATISVAGLTPPTQPGANLSAGSGTGNAEPIVRAPSTTVSASATSVTINKPGGTISGDLILLTAYQRATAAVFTGPAGFTSLGATTNTGRVQAWYRVADGTEGTSFGVSSTVSATWALSCLSISGHSGLPSWATLTGNSTTATTPVAEATLNNTLVLAIYSGGNASHSDLIAPAGFTELVDIRSNVSTTASWQYVARQTSSTGSVAAASVTVPSQPWMAAAVLVNPVPTGPQTLDVGTSPAVAQPGASVNLALPIRLDYPNPNVVSTNGLPNVHPRIIDMPHDGQGHQGFSHIVYLGGGQLVSVYASGARHSLTKRGTAGHGVILLARSIDYGANWTVTTIVDSPNQDDDRDPNLAFIDGQWVLTYPSWVEAPEWSDVTPATGCQLFYRTSPDLVTWSAATRVRPTDHPGLDEYLASTTPMFKTPGGTYVIPATGRLLAGQTDYSALMLTATSLAGPWTTTVIGNGPADARSYDEPYAARLADGTYLAYSRYGSSGFARYTSTDAVTWTAPVQQLAGNSGRPSWIQLQSGTIILGARTSDTTNVLRFSRDKGLTWTAAVTLPPIGARLATYISFVEPHPNVIATAHSKEDTLESGRMYFTYVLDGTDQGRTVATPPFDPTDGHDCTAEMNSWLNGLAAGTTADLGAASYRINGTVLLSGKTDVQVVGSAGCKFWTDWHTADNKPLSSIVGAPIVSADRTRAHVRIDNCSSIVFRNVDVAGPHAAGGTADSAYVVELEAQHGYDVLNSSNVLIDDCDVRNVYGDLAYGGKSSSGVTFRAVTGGYNGRQGFAFSRGSDFIVENCDITEIRRAHVDCEPNVSTDLIDRVTIRNNTFRTKRLNAFSAYGPGVVSNVTITGNRYECPFNSFVRAHTGQRRANWTVTNNTATLPYGSSSTIAMNFGFVDGITVTGNHIPMDGGRGMFLGGLEDCSNITWSGNTTTNDANPGYKLIGGSTLTAASLATVPQPGLTLSPGTVTLPTAGIAVPTQTGANLAHVYVAVYEPWWDWVATTTGVPVLPAKVTAVAEPTATTVEVPGPRATTIDV